MRSHGWYDLPPFSYDAGRGVLTTVVAGPATWTFRARDGWLEVGGARGEARSARAAARRIFSLDVELSAFDGALADQPALRRALARGGGRMLRAPTLFEDAVKMLLTTNCSWAATRGMVQRLVALSGDGSFPGPEALARMRPDALGRKVRCGYRAGALSRFSRRVASGRLDLSAWERRETPATELREAILAEHGFGPYAAEGLLRVLGPARVPGGRFVDPKTVPAFLSGPGEDRRRGDCPPLRALWRIPGPGPLARHDPRVARGQRGHLALALGVHTSLGRVLTPV